MYRQDFYTKSSKWNGQHKHMTHLTDTCKKAIYLGLNWYYVSYYQLKQKYIIMYVLWLKNKFIFHIKVK